MKFATTPILTFLAMLSVSVTEGQKTRGATAQRELDPVYWGEDSSSGSSKRGDCECEGFFYYEYRDFAREIDWMEAYEATPFGCVLTTVGSMGELKEIEEVAGANNAWVGIIKSAGDIADPLVPDTAGWYNLDGTMVPDDPMLWGANSASNMEPNNSPPYQTRAHWWGTGQSASGRTGLRDLNSVPRAGPAVDGAVYKCCGRNVNTCVNFKRRIINS